MKRNMFLRDFAQKEIEIEFPVGHPVSKQLKVINLSRTDSSSSQCKRTDWHKRQK